MRPSAQWHCSPHGGVAAFGVDRWQRPHGVGSCNPRGGGGGMLRQCAACSML
jgi:hypothetical protein